MESKRGKTSLLRPHNTIVNTTLYELIEAINEEIKPEEKRLIPEIVINLLSTCRSNCWVQSA